MYISLALKQKDYDNNPDLFVDTLRAFNREDVSFSDSLKLYKKCHARHKEEFRVLVSKSSSERSWYSTDDISLAIKNWDLLSDKAKRGLKEKIIYNTANEHSSRSRNKWGYRQTWLAYLGSLMKKGVVAPIEVVKIASEYTGRFYFIKNFMIKHGLTFKDKDVIKVLAKSDWYYVSVLTSKQLRQYRTRRKLMKDLSEHKGGFLHRRLTGSVQFTKQDVMSMKPHQRFLFLKHYFRSTRWPYKITAGGLGRKVKLKDLSKDDVHLALFPLVIEEHSEVSKFLKDYNEYADKKGL